MSAGRTGAHDDEPAATPLEVITGAVVIGLLGLVLAATAFVMPARTVEDRTSSYTQDGTFTYSADASADSIYGPDGVVAGQPLLLDLVGPVTVDFDYRIVGDDVSGVTGSGSMDVVVELPPGIERRVPLDASASLAGDRLSLTAELPVNDVRDLARQAAQTSPDAGVAGSGTNFVVRPTVEVSGTASGDPFDATWSPTLHFNLVGSTLVLGDGTVGAEATSVEDALTPSKRDDVALRVDVANRVPLLVAHPTVASSRVAGLGVALLCLLVGLWAARPLLRSRGAGGERARVQALYGSRIVPVADFDAAGAPVATVASMDKLADVAKRMEAPILRLSDEDHEDYLVWDAGMVLRYRAGGD